MASVFQLVLDAMHEVGEFFHFSTQIIARHHIAHRNTHSGQLSRQEFGIRLGFRRAASILIQGDAVAVILAVLRQQNQGAA